MCMCGVHVCDVHVCDVVCVHVAYSTSVHDVVCVRTCDVMFILSVRGGRGCVRMCVHAAKLLDGSVGMNAHVRMYMCF